MDTFQLRVFQRQVADQCRYFMMAGDQIDKSLAEGGSDPFWYALQNMLTAAANISKVLWGASGKLAEERRPVRESLQVPEDSPLQSTDLRNHFEHFDERIDRWWAESPAHNYIDLIMGPPNMMVVEPHIPLDFFRHYDPQTAIARFWGDDYDLHLLAEAVEALLPIAQGEASKPHWDNPPEMSGSGQ